MEGIYMAENLKEMVYRSIMEDIVNDVYKPLQILNESSMIERYKCSKSPVREALQSLCSDGVLRSIPRCGYEVLVITQDEIIELLNTRYLIEAGFAVQVLEKIQPGNMEKLEELVTSLASCREDMWKYWEINTQFHLELIKVAGNSYAHSELEKICSKLKMAYAQLTRSNWKSGCISFEVKNHKAILASIRRKDLCALRETLRTDLLGFCDLQYKLVDFFGCSKS